jgi:hypothetical protein
MLDLPRSEAEVEGLKLQLAQLQNDVYGSQAHTAGASPAHILRDHILAMAFDKDRLLESLRVALRIKLHDVIPIRTRSHKCVDGCVRHKKCHVVECILFRKHSAHVRANIHTI